VNILNDSGHQPLPSGHIDYDDLHALESDLLAAVGGKQIFAEKLRSFFRSAIDEVIDTARTNRFFLSQLEKTEKTYLGTKFENLLRDWLQVPRGIVLDLKIGGREVDVKSTTGGRSGWMIPREALEQLCVLLRVNESASTCAVGLVRARKAYLRSGENQDKKTSFSAEGIGNIWWMVRDFAYTPNFWNSVSDDVRNEIMKPKGGTARLVKLFENCLEIPVSRVLISGVAKQDDFMKRLRKNGGARDKLARAGIAVLYSGYDRNLMQELGLKVGHREFQSYRPKTSDEVLLLRNAGKID